MIEFTIWGEPQGKARPRVTRTGPAEPPQKTVCYEAEIIASFRRDCPRFIRWEKGVPLRVMIQAVYSVPASAPAMAKAKMLQGQTLPTKKPDADNIGKVILDALNGILWHDDAQVVSLTTTKSYGKEPCVNVRVAEAKF